MTAHEFGDVHTEKRPPELSQAELTCGESFCLECQTWSNWGRNSWCSRCGFCPADPDWESDMVNDQQQSTLLPEPLIPLWFKVLMIGTLSILTVSVSIHIWAVLNEFRPLVWTQFQIGIGLLGAIGAHIATGFFAARDAKLTVATGVVFHPMKIWKTTFKRIRQHYLRFCIFWWSLFAAALAVVLDFIF